MSPCYFPIAPLWDREIRGAELAARSVHHPASPTAIQGANRAGREISTHLPRLCSSRQETARKAPPGTERRAPAVLGDGGELEQSYCSSTAFGKGQSIWEQVCACL